MRANKNFEEIKLYEKFNINPDEYKAFYIIDCGFSSRIENALLKNSVMRIKTVYDLLMTATDFFKRIRNIDPKGIEEIENFVSIFRDDNFNVDEYHIASKLNIPYDIFINRFNIINGDLSFMNGKNYSYKDYAILKKYIESIYIIEPELLQLCYIDPKKVQAIGHQLFSISFILDIERRKRNQANY